mmetsp:Transcript_68197/g.127301  ORF Transcript_68197/g.127301 Transcript_68197/m.127301 type:complete len:213 (-) Transcript_68197:49-687(-)
MKRTISHEAQVAAARLRALGFTPSLCLPSSGGSDPCIILGLRRDSISEWAEIRQAFIARIRQYPPEQRPEEFVHILDAYETLKKQWREAEPAVETGGPSKRRRIDSSQGSSSQPAVIALDASGVAHLNASSPPPPVVQAQQPEASGIASRNPFCLASPAAPATALPQWAPWQSTPRQPVQNGGGLTHHSPPLIPQGVGEREMPVCDSGMIIG